MPIEITKLYSIWSKFTYVNNEHASTFIYIYFWVIAFCCCVLHRDFPSYSSCLATFNAFLVIFCVADSVRRAVIFLSFLFLLARRVNSSMIYVYIYESMFTAIVFFFVVVVWWANLCGARATINSVHNQTVNVQMLNFRSHVRIWILWICFVATIKKNKSTKYCNVFNCFFLC